MPGLYLGLRQRYVLILLTTNTSFFIGVLRSKPNDLKCSLKKLGMIQYRNSTGICFNKNYHILRKVLSNKQKRLENSGRVEKREKGRGGKNKKANKKNQIKIITIIIFQLKHSKIILENTVEIEPQPIALDFKNLSQYSRLSK